MRADPPGRADREHMEFEDPVSSASAWTQGDSQGERPGGSQSAHSSEASAPAAHDVLESLPHGVLVIDGDGRVLETNGRLCAMTGFAPGELVGAAEALPFWPEDTSERLAIGLG